VRSFGNLSLNWKLIRLRDPKFWRQYRDWREIREYVRVQVLGANWGPDVQKRLLKAVEVYVVRRWDSVFGVATVGRDGDLEIYVHLEHPGLASALARHLSLATSDGSQPRRLRVTVFTPSQPTGDYRGDFLDGACVEHA
jgi:hypothetical protein